ncbi:MAG TPA: hypothetical protein VFC24_18655, partial [Casimicrobiaceae bacterium]|nr:hypothetical protein [Casimicrobiaceae bacterium]
MSALRIALLVAVASALLAGSAQAATDGELAEIRDQIRQMKEQYETRIRALEEKLKAAEAAPASAPAAPASAPAAPPAPASAAGPTTGGGLAAFNPAISLVLQGTYANLKQDPRQYTIAGFQKTDEVSPGRRGLGLGESELSLAASVDPNFAGNLTVSLTPENTVSVEEAYGLMPSLSNGVVPKFGRFFSGIGYLNEQHQHAWDFVDAPLAYQALLGGQFTQDGVQVKWVAPIEQFVELGAEIGNGDSFPGSFRNRNSAGAAAVYAHTGGDVGVSHSWRAGLSYLQTRADDRVATQLDSMGNLADVAFSGRSHVVIADLVWKYAPNGNPLEHNFRVQGEYLWKRDRGDLTYDASGTLGMTRSDAYSAN